MLEKNGYLYLLKTLWLFIQDKILFLLKRQYIKKELEMSKEIIVKHENSIGFLGLLFIVFLVLKWTSVINWSWWWITAPLWIPWALVILFLLGLFIISLIVG